MLAHLVGDRDDVIGRLHLRWEAHTLRPTSVEPDINKAILHSALNAVGPPRRVSVASLASSGQPVQSVPQVPACWRRLGSIAELRTREIGNVTRSKVSHRCSAGGARRRLAQ